LVGLVDDYLDKNPMGEYYKTLAKDLKSYGHDHERWEDYYRFAEFLCDALFLKCEIAQNLRRAYLSDDQAYLKKVAEEMLPLLYEKIDRQHKLHKKMWYKTYKPFGFEVIDVRYGGLKAALKLPPKELKIT